MLQTISVQGLTKYYGDFLAVDHIDFEVAQGEIFGFLGPNGAGKTSTIRMLTGLSKPSNGKATVNGYNIGSQSLEVKRYVGIVPEESILFNELTVEENLRFLAQLYDVPAREIKGRINELLEMFSLTEKGTESFEHLSKGLKRRVALASALIHRPSVLFLDEPTSGLDLMSQRNLISAIRDLNKKGTTIFLTTHNILEADQLCDRISVIVKGKILATESPEKLKSRVQNKQMLEVGLAGMGELLINHYQEISGVNGAIKIGDKVRLMTTNVTDTLQGLSNWVNANNLSITSINSVMPSLEDAFIQISDVNQEVIHQINEGGEINDL